MRPATRLDIRSFTFSAGTVAAILFTLCALAVAISPGSTTALASYLVHLDLTALARPLTWASFIGGLVFWAIGTGLVFGAVAGLYNRFAGRPSARAAERLPVDERA